jgi:hydrogenase expression/formation protein HypC
MCLAIPGLVTNVLSKTKATVDFGGVKRTVDTTFIDHASTGDWVLVHVGCAIQKVEEAAARETYRLLAESRSDELKQELAMK